MVTRLDGKAFRVLYTGPGLSGRACTIAAIAELHFRSRASVCETPAGYSRVLQATIVSAKRACSIVLYSHPGALRPRAVDAECIRAADGIVFVVDSQLVRLETNNEWLKITADQFRAAGRDLQALPRALQYNKRDLPDIATFEQLQHTVNAAGWPAFESVARTGRGVLAPLAHVCGELGITDILNDPT